MKSLYLRGAEYGGTLELQRKEFQSRVEARKSRSEMPDDLIIFTEHLPVYTLGKHGDSANLLVSREQLKRNGAHVFRIERGGDITYHGPGQITVYPIIDLQRYHLGVKDYVALLEEAVIETIARYGIKGERVEGATGVWIESDSCAARKICAIGVKCSRHITMHGLALNVGWDLSGFSAINPCGFKDKGVTSVSRELGREVSVDEVKEKLEKILSGLLGRRKERASEIKECDGGDSA